jgi:hypothetical protein
MSHQPEAQSPHADPLGHDLASFSLWEQTEAPNTEYWYSHAPLPQHTVRVKDLPAEERPRDRLMKLGAKSLSTGELLSILLSTGQGQGRLSALGLGQHILVSVFIFSPLWRGKQISRQ